MKNNDVIIEVERHIFEEDYTVGKLKVDGNYICDVIEDKVRVLNRERDKVLGRTAIPAGKYRVVLDYSNRFGKIMPHLLDVPYFKGIRIHKGNSANDSSGCLIVCYYDKNGWGINSAKAYGLVYDVINKSINSGKNVFIDIK